MCFPFCINSALAFPVHRNVTSKLASAAAEAITAPAVVVSYTPKTTSISSGALPIVRSFSTTSLQQVRPYQVPPQGSLWPLLACHRALHGLYH
jgi:hypothetical protein